MYSYILLSSIVYEGTWTLGVVNSLDEANNYFVKNVKKKNLSETKMSSEELVQRALDDEWDDYIKYYVEVWDNTQRICSYKYNSTTSLLEKIT